MQALRKKVFERERQYQKNMKAIILAAGQGRRLNNETKDRPKCLIEIGGQTILSKIISAIREAGISDVSLVRGYKREKFDDITTRYYDNLDYKTTNMLFSLYIAKAELNDDCVISYSDIIYEPWVIKKLVNDKNDISLLVDVEWRKHYEGRKHHPVKEAELVYMKDGRMVRFGKDIAPEDAYGEFVGLLKLSKKGAEILYSQLKRLFNSDGKNRFHQAASVRHAYLTDMFQELAERGFSLANVDIKNGWHEIDTEEDLKRVKTLHRRELKYVKDN